MLFKRASYRVNRNKILPISKKLIYYGVYVLLIEIDMSISY